jgi:hypothetical protein
MALELSYTSETPVEDGYQGVLTDDTSYGTGGNPVRASGVVYLTGNKINYDDSVAEAIEINDYDPETATDFTFTIPTDGWEQFLFCYIPNYNIATAYVQYDAVYLDGVVYRATQASTGQTPPNGTYWEVIEEPTSLVENDGLATESPNIESLVYNIIIFPEAKKKFGDAAEEYAIKCCGTFRDDVEFTAFKELGAITTALQGCNVRSRWASGEKISRYAEQL